MLDSSPQQFIFFNVLPQNENAVTEVLAGLLRKKNILRLFFSLSNITELKQINFNDTSFCIDSQRIFQDEQIIPDLVLESNDWVFFIENKIHYQTSLLDTQKLSGERCSYVETLKKSFEKENKGLIYLVPDGYGQQEIEDVQKQYVKENVYIRSIVWSDFLALLEDYKNYEDYPLIKEAVYYFSMTIDLNKDNVCTREDLMIEKNVFKEGFSFMSRLEKIRLLFIATQSEIVQKLNQEATAAGKEQFEESVFSGFNSYGFNKDFFSKKEFGVWVKYGKEFFWYGYCGNDQAESEQVLWKFCLWRGNTIVEKDFFQDESIKNEQDAKDYSRKFVEEIVTKITYDIKKDNKPKE